MRPINVGGPQIIINKRMNFKVKLLNINILIGLYSVWGKVDDANIRLQFDRTYIFYHILP